MVRTVFGRVGAPIMAGLMLVARTAAAAVPDLPRIEVGGFEPLIREQVGKLYRAARGNPRDGAASGRLGLLLHAYQQFELAEPCLERAYVLDPEEARWAYFLGLARRELGKHAESVGVFREVLRRRPEYQAARFKLADALLASGKLAEAEREYTALVEADATLAAAHYGLGRCRTARGEHAAASAAYGRACELQPDFGSAHYALALAYRELGDASRAAAEIAAYKRNKLGGPPRRDPWLDEAERLRAGGFHSLRAGVALEAAGDLEASIAAHERAVELDPRGIQAHMNLIPLYARAGRADKVEEHYRAAVAINPSLEETHYNFGVFLTKTGRNAEAVAAFTKALAVNPQFVDARSNLAFLLMADGKLDEAEQHYRRALEISPNHRLANFNLGRILVHRGKLADAVAHFQLTLVPRDESTAGYLYALGATYARLGERARAVETLREARADAAERNQSELVASIDRDLRTLEGARGKP